MKFKASQIAEILEGTIVGNPDAEVSELAKIEEGKDGSLTFLSNPKYTSYIYSTKASITIVNDSFEADQTVSTTLIKVKDAILIRTDKLSKKQVLIKMSKHIDNVFKK